MDQKVIQEEAQKLHEELLVARKCKDFSRSDQIRVILQPYEPSAFYTDNMFDEWSLAAAPELHQLDIALGWASHRIVVFPSYGIGTGRARLAQTSPKIFEYLNNKLSILGIRNGLNIQ